MTKDIQALKAVSQNLMHSNISITDGVYGVLSDIDVRSQITTLGQKIVSSEIEGIEEIKAMIKPLLKLLGASQY